MKLLAFALIFLGCSTSKTSTNHLKTIGQSIVQMAKERQDPKLIAIKAEEFLSQARVVVSKAKSKYPTCRPLFEAILKDEERIKSLGLTEVETLYHEGEALPETDEIACYNVKELIVHPATVVVLAKQIKFAEEHYAQMVDEMEEVIEHMSDI